MLGFLRNLFRRRLSEPVSPASPVLAHSQLFGGPDDATPMVIVHQGKTVVITDRMAYEYQAGLTVGDDPSQMAIDQAFAPADRVRILAGGMYTDSALGREILVEENDPDAISELILALRIVEDPATFDHCMCLGHPAIEFYSGMDLIGTIALHHGRSVRWHKWKHDARLANQPALLTWMLDHGIESDKVTSPGDNAEILDLLALTSAQRHAGRGDSYRQRGDRERALAECARAIRHDPNLAVAFAIKSAVLHDLGQVEEATKIAEVALAKGFDRPEFRVELANTYQDGDNCDRALVLCDEAIGHDPNFAPAYDVRGLTLLKLDRRPEALEAFAKAETLAPNWPPPCWHTAMTRAISNEHATAIEAFTRFLGLMDVHPDLPVDRPTMKSLAHALRGRSRLAVGDLPAARQDGSDAIFLDPDHPEGYRTRGMALEMMGAPREAITDYAELIRLRPDDDADAYRRMASAQAGSGDHEGLLAALQHVLEIQPDDAEARFAQAQALLNLERPEEAIEALNEALALRPDSAMGYSLRSFCWRQLDRPELVFEDLENALRWEPDNPVLLNNSAWLLATNSDPDLRDGKKALARAEKALVTTEGKVSFVLGTLSAALAECGRMREALEALKKAMMLEAPPETRRTQFAMKEAFEAGDAYRDED
jgi:tetratricopeptide (TPR) repeat protein